MNTIVIAPEVLTFVASVRAQLADLEPEEMLEITDGLEADLTELVQEQGVGALGDPIAYASELRAAAGLADGVRRSRRPVRASAVGFLDACHERVDTVLAKAPRDVAPLLAWLRPLWWVLRAWTAVQLAQLVYARNPWSGTDLIPDVRGFGLPVLILATVVSVWVGLGWRAGRWSNSLLARLVVLAVNLGLLAALPAVAAQVDSGDARYADGVSQGFSRGYSHGMNDNLAGNEVEARAGLYADGHWVSNIYPYDAAGKPLVGVQLFDQNGKPVDVVTATECVYDDGDQPIDAGRQYFPWSDGAAQKHNVFPVASKVTSGSTPDPDPLAFAGKDRPTVSGFPFAKVPSISLPGLLTSTAKTPAKAFVPGPRTGPINPVDNGC